MQKLSFPTSLGWWSALAGGVLVVAACSSSVAAPTGETLPLPSPPGGGSGSSSGGVEPEPLPIEVADAGAPIALQPNYPAVVTQAVAPPPISGGTLLLSQDGTRVFAADPDRDAVYVVNLTSATSVTVALQAGDEPGRAVEDAAGNIDVVLRGSGAVASINPTTRAVTRSPVCARPRGIAYLAASDSLYVACAGGELVTLPAAGGAPTRTVIVEPDLRDAVVVGSNLYVSELRSATILQIAADGSIANRFLRPGTLGLEAGVAWRMIAVPGGLAMSLQAASTSPINPQPGSYGMGGCGNAVTNSAIAVWSLDGTSQGATLAGGVLPVDLAYSARASAFALVTPGEWLIPGSPQLVMTPLAVAADDGGVPAPPPGCPGGQPIPTATGQATAVTYDLQGRLIVQTREPAALIIDALGSPTTVSLSSVSRDDSGHEIFHSDQGGGIACASCHIEGGEDGRTWLFSDVGQRRTPSVLGTVKGTAPYHWDGSQIDLPMLYTGSLARMSGPTLSPAQQTAFTSWLDALRPPTPSPGDADAIARGAALFTGTGGCATCHSGASFTNNQTIDVGTGQAFQVPPLLGVSARPPFLHDGRAPTLVDAIGPNGHPKLTASASLTSAQLSDLATYLESL